MLPLWVFLALTLAAFLASTVAAFAGLFVAGARGWRGDANERATSAAARAAAAAMSPSFGCGKPSSSPGRAAEIETAMLRRPSGQTESPRGGPPAEGRSPTGCARRAL